MLNETILTIVVRTARGSAMSRNKKDKKTSIEDKSSNNNVTLVSIDNVNPHEEITEPTYLESLIRSIKESKVFNEPVIIDKNTYVILDGHHRYLSLKKLGAKYLPAVLLDYLNDADIYVDTWYPYIIGDPEVVLNSLKNLEEISVRQVDTENEMWYFVNESKAVFGLITREPVRYFIIMGSGDLYDEQKRVIRHLNKIPQIKIKYIDNVEKGKKLLKSREASILLVRRPPSKLEVIRRATLGKVFPPKTTRHKLPFVVKKVNISLNDLL